MSDVTRILAQIEQGQPQAAEKLLPLVYEELKKLAAVRLAREKPGQTLSATSLVHEAYISLVGPREGKAEPCEGEAPAEPGEREAEHREGKAEHREGKADHREGDAERR